MWSVDRKHKGVWEQWVPNGATNCLLYCIKLILINLRRNGLCYIQYGDNQTVVVISLAVNQINAIFWIKSAASIWIPPVKDQFRNASHKYAIKFPSRGSKLGVKTQLDFGIYSIWFAVCGRCKHGRIQIRILEQRGEPMGVRLFNI